MCRMIWFCLSSFGSEITRQGPVSGNPDRAIMVPYEMNILMVYDFVTNIVVLFGPCKIIMEKSQMTFRQTPRNIRINPENSNVKNFIEIREKTVEIRANRSMVVKNRLRMQRLRATKSPTVRWKETK